MVVVRFITLDSVIKTGVIIVDHRLVDDIAEVFELAYSLRYPIESISPVSAFNFDDDWSMASNNSSGFNYRRIAGTDDWSLHAFGMAIDLNPKYNPMIVRGIMHPPCGVIDPNHPCHLHSKHPIVRCFKRLGWTWGGEWEEPFDPHHFQKDLRTAS